MPLRGALQGEVGAGRGISFFTERWQSATRPEHGQTHSMKTKKMKTKTRTKAGRSALVRCDALVRRFSRDEKSSLAHALDHVLVNKIADDGCLQSGWYCGNREQFVARHKKSIAFLRSLLSPNAGGQPDGKKIMSKKLTSAKTTGAKPVCLERMVRLSEHEYVETAYAQHAAGPGWSNTPLWIVITDGATGKTRKACLQPDEQTTEMHTLYSFAALAHESMMSAVSRVIVKANVPYQPRGASLVGCSGLVSPLPPSEP